MSIRNQSGFSIVEATVSIVLFSAFFIGAVTLFANWQKGEQERQNAEVISKTAIIFLRDIRTEIDTTKIYSLTGSSKNTVDSDIVADLSTDYLAPTSTHDFVTKWSDRLDRRIGKRTPKWEVSIDTTNSTIALTIKGTTPQFTLEY